MISSSLQILWNSSKRKCIILLILSFVISLPNIINIYIWKLLLDQIVACLKIGSFNHKILYLLVIGFTIEILRIILIKIESYIRAIYILMVDKYITQNIIDCIYELSMTQLEDNNILNIIQKSSEESMSRSMQLLDSVANIISAFSTVIVSVLLLIKINIFLPALIFISIFPSLKISYSNIQIIHKIYEDRIEKTRFIYFLKNMIVQNNSLKEIKISGSILYLKKLIDGILMKIIDQEKVIKSSINKKICLSEAFEQIIMYMIKFFIIYRSIILKTSIGNISMNIELISRLQGAFLKISTLIISLFESSLYMENFKSLNLLKNENIKENSNLIKEKINFKVKEIEFKNIYFKYKNSKNYVLSNVNLKFNKGFTYAIVGLNGSGKTTLIKLLLGLYRPDKGSIYINKNELYKNYNLKEYNSKFSVMFQDFVKYPLSVYENIALGDCKNFEDIFQIKKSSFLSMSDKFINKLPKKYDTKLIKGWEDSVDISEGQWQRIALARTYFNKNADIIILDEPSASLDTFTESSVFTNLLNSFQDKIKIIITHRFINIENMDKIIVIDQGKIIGTGKHSELISNCQKYKLLYNMQKKQSESY